MHLVGRCVLISLTRHSDLMNHNGKQMKFGATHLTESQRCVIFAKLSKLNALSKRATFDDANNAKYCVVMLEDVDKVLEMTRIEGPPLDDEIQPIKILAAFESATDFKGPRALHNIVLNIDGQLLCSNVHAEVGEMYDEL